MEQSATENERTFICKCGRKVEMIPDPEFGQNFGECDCGALYTEGEYGEPLELVEGESDEVNQSPPNPPAQSAARNYLPFSKP